MKKIINAPENYVDEMLQGIYASFPDQVKCAADDPRCYCIANKKPGKAAYALDVHAVVRVGRVDVDAGGDQGVVDRGALVDLDLGGRDLALAGSGVDLDGDGDGAPVLGARGVARGCLRAAAGHDGKRKRARGGGANEARKEGSSRQVLLGHRYLALSRNGGRREGRAAGGRARGPRHSRVLVRSQTGILFSSRRRSSDRAVPSVCGWSQCSRGAAHG